MKSIIMTAQNVRDFLKERTLTLEKSSTATPYEIGDVVFIREPWYRMKNPSGGDSDRFNYAANAVVEPIAYKWASPVAMPAAAIRHYARVAHIVDKGETNGDGVTTSQEITLELISKAEAEATAAGLPFSTATDPEGASDYYTYSGDMTPEDHEKMIAAIDTDRARLSWVRDRLREIDDRLKVISRLLFEEMDKVDPNAVAALHEENEALQSEQIELAQEEREITAALEDAGVRVEPSDEEKAALTEEAFDTLAGISHDERKREIDSRLAEITARLDTIADIEKSPEQFTAEALEEVAAERAELTEETHLLKRELAELNGTPTEGELSESDDTPGPRPTTGDAAEPDDEIGSFTLGKCKYCAREWGVTLEGAPGGGYPTQRTANAAATRACNCEEATANRSEILGVALAVTVGGCRYCGQMQEVGPHPSQASADDTATEVCSCPQARIERRVEEQVEDACDRIRRLFGEGAEELGFTPLAENGSISLLERVAELIARRTISSATVQVRGSCKAKLALTTKGKIKVARSETRSYDLEAGE